jgi:glycosyltransferase involved in cell wall biosynthesis
MKILMVNTVYKRGGTARIAQTLHRELNALNGCECLFAYGRGPKAEEPKTIRFATQIEVYLHALLTRVSGIQGYGTWLSTKRLIRLIQEWKADVIHFHNIHGYYLDLSIANAVDRLGIPVIWTLHDAWSLTGRCAYFFDCERWRDGCGQCPYPWEYPKAYFDSSAWMWRRKRKLLWEAWNPVIVTPSQWLANCVLEIFAGRYRVEVIPNGIDTEVFRPQNQWRVRKKLGLPDDKRIILFAAADLKVKRKGLRYFFKSLSYIEADRWMVVIVGKPIGLPQALPDRVDIRQLGCVTGSESMADVYSAADLFCITSLDDNFPTTVLEAMSCGTPVVGFSVGGIPEQVADGCGRLVPPLDAKGLGEAMTALLNDNSLRQEMGAWCRERATKEYNLEHFIECYLTLYHELCGGGR